MQCGSCKKVQNQREKEAESGRAERVECNAYERKDAVIEGKVKRNEKEKVFYSPCRIEKKVP